MLVLEFKTYPNEHQIGAIEKGIRVLRFLRNKSLRSWEDNPNIKPYDLNEYTAVLAKEFDCANKLNSMARQASAERVALAIKRFYLNSRENKPGKKDYPKYQKNNRSIEYKTSGWKLSDNRKYITLTDKLPISKLKCGMHRRIRTRIQLEESRWLKGTRNLNYYQPDPIKRVRILRRNVGYIGLDYFDSDSNGNHVENPRKLRKLEKRLKRLQKQVSCKKKGSSNRRKAIDRLGRQHKDHTVKTASALVKSSNLVVYKDLEIKNPLKNRKLAKSISDASWSMFTDWVEYYSKLHGTVCVAVAPNHTSQDCSSCGQRVKKTISQRTHICDCGCNLQRDVNAAKNILAKGLKMLGVEFQNTVGQTEINASGQNDLCFVSESLQSKLAG